MDNLKLLFGRRLKEYRIKNKMTQTKLAELADVDNKHISCIESGKNFPSSSLIQKFADILEVEPKDFFEFYHLQNKENLKTDIVKMLNNLEQDDLSLVYKYIRNFIL